MYTVDSEEVVDDALELGVERITGDFPAQIDRHLNGKKVFPANNGVLISDALNDAQEVT